jgi:hypothetical protein
VIIGIVLIFRGILFIATGWMLHGIGRAPAAAAGA